MKVTQTLRMNYEFSRVYNKGRYFTSRHVVLHVLRRSGQANHLGVTASRRIKGSVQRNRIKRLLRESYRLLEDQLQTGYDLILVGRPADDQPDCPQIREEISRLFQKASLIKPTAAASETGSTAAQPGEQEST